MHKDTNCYIQQSVKASWLTCSAQVVWSSGATSVQTVPGEGPLAGENAAAAGSGAPGEAVAVATGVAAATGDGETAEGEELGWVRPPGANRVALVGLGVGVAVAAYGLGLAAVVGEGLAVVEGVAVGEGDLDPLAPALRRAVERVLAGVAVGLTFTVEAGVAAVVGVTVVTGVAPAVAAGVLRGDGLEAAE